MHIALQCVQQLGLVEYSRYVVMVTDHYKIRTCAIEGSMVDEPNERAHLFTSEPTHPNSSCNACLHAQTVLHSSEGGGSTHTIRNSKFIAMFSVHFSVLNVSTKL